MKKKIKEIKYLEPKFFTEFHNDVEYVVSINHNKSDITKAIEKALNELFEQDVEYVDYINVVRPSEPTIVIEQIGVEKDEI